MPKKLSTNPKADAARERKADKKKEEKERSDKATDDAKWQDNDVFNAKKSQRKDEKEQKRLAMLQRKQEAKSMLEQEESTQPGKSAVSGASAKVTRAHIAEEKQRQASSQKKKEKPKEAEDEIFTEGNPNREMAELLAKSGAIEARNVEEAISVLSIGGSASADKHPEKRMKAAYTAFEAERLPQLKAENPNFRLSQLKQMLRKEWLKSPDNPMNQMS